MLSIADMNFVKNLMIAEVDAADARIERAEKYKDDEHYPYYDKKEYESVMKRSHMAKDRAERIISHFEQEIAARRSGPRSMGTVAHKPNGQSYRERG